MYDTAMAFKGHGLKLCQMRSERRENGMKSFFVFQFSPPGGQVTPKLWAPLNLACQDGSFGTLESQIGHMVMEIITIDEISDGHM